MITDEPGGEWAISPVVYEALERKILTTLEERRDDLINVSRTIWRTPEIAYQEHEAAALLTAKLTQGGFLVERGVADIETAFIARAGAGDGPTVAVLAEYDALPGIGHACGHNLMATAALGAGLALREVIDHLPGKVAVYGTPAEEGGGGKVLMVQRGAFKGVDAALIFHPASYNMVGRGSLASTRVNLAFYGKASHAAASPDKGINALDAIIQTYNNVNALRQQLRPDARVMGVITNGGQAANIIPDYASAHFSIRATDRRYADEVLEKFRRCAEAAALATGARLEFEVIEASRYDNMLTNSVLGELFRKRLVQLGLEVEDPTGEERMGSTDMGNVSQVLPAIHPYLSIGEKLNGHTIEFREASGSDFGQETMLNAARAMALTALDLLARPALLVAAQDEFQKSRP